MKRLFMLAALGLATATAMPAFSGNFTGKTAPNDDTIQVKLANGARMTLVVDNTNQLKSFRKHSLDSLMLTLEKYITEADKNQKDLKGKDYTVTYKPTETDKSKKTPEKISITFKGMSKDGDGDMNIDVTYDDNNTENKVIKIGNSDSDTTQTAKAKRNRRTESDFVVGFGFNALLNTGDGMLGTQIDLRPYGSRFVSLAYRTQTRIGGQKSPLHVRSGIDFTFNNYMFDGNILVNDETASGDNYTWFVEDNSRQLIKSKLATSAVNIPVVMVLDFKNAKGKSNFRIGGGGFAGYRLGAHTKIKYAEGGRTKKDHNPGNYNLQDFQYGLKGIIGFRSLEFFANYNLNELFKDNRGPKANTLSFGINVISI